MRQTHHQARPTTQLEVAFLVQSDGSGSKFLTQIGSGKFFVAWVRKGVVSHLWLGNISLTNCKFLNFLSLDQKNLIEVGQKVPRLKSG